jgi:hypothetical protein
VSKIMNSARPGSRLGDSSVERQTAKRVVRHTPANGPHPRRQEQMIIGSGKHQAGVEIGIQCRRSRRMQRDQSTLAALASTNEKNAVWLNIAQPYVERLRYPQSSRKQSGRRVSHTSLGVERTFWEASPQQRRFCSAHLGSRCKASICPVEVGIGGTEGLHALHLPRAENEQAARPH